MEPLVAMLEAGQRTADIATALKLTPRQVRLRARAAGFQSVRDGSEIGTSHWERPETELAGESAPPDVPPTTTPEPAHANGQAHVNGRTAGHVEPVVDWDNADEQSITSYEALLAAPPALPPAIVQQPHRNLDAVSLGDIGEITQLLRTVHDSVRQANNVIVQLKRREEEMRKEFTERVEYLEARVRQAEALAQQNAQQARSWQEMRTHLGAMEVQLIQRNVREDLLTLNQTMDAVGIEEREAVPA